MIGSGEGGDDDLVRAARAYREGRIGREALLGLVEAWASGGPGPVEDSDATVIHPRTDGGPASVGGGPAASSWEGTRFRVVEVHAEGGLGTVYRAIDAELGREVALKQIRPDRADDPESRARFEREGTITGALEHPGVVPVYGRGRFDDGRPFFAMRLVRGRSLREAIADLHRGAPLAGGPGADATLRSLVGRLVRACDAVEYAHSRGVVHRDIKPENILLGPFGETLVVDWGLARLAGADDAADRLGDEMSPPPPPSSGGAGRVEGGGRGTGRGIPGRGPSPPAPPPASGEGGGIEPEPAGGAAGVRRQVQGHGQGPIIDPAPTGEKTEGERARSGTETVAWAAGSGPIGVIVDEGAPWETRAGHVRGTVAYMSPEQARGEHDRVGPRTDVYGLGASLYCLLTGRAPIATEGGLFVALGKAIRGEVEPPGALRAEVDPELERICLKAMAPDPDRRHPTARALAEALDEWLAEERARTARALFASALEAFGALVTTVQDRLGALPAAREAREELLATAVTGLEGLIEHAERGQSAEVERALAEAHRQLGEIALRLGRSAEAGGHLERSLKAFEALVASGKPEPGDRRGLAVVLGRLGDVCRRRGDAAGARHYYRRGLVASRSLAAVEPRSGRAQRGLAIAYGKLGDLARRSGDPSRARTYHRRSLAIADALARAAPDGGDAMRSVAMALDKLGDVERQLGDLDAARRYYRRALSVADALAEARPDDPGAIRSIIISGNKLGELHRQAGDLDAARAAFERSMTLAEARAEADPGDVDARRDVSICCDRLGDVCRRAGDLAAASAHYARGLELARSLMAADPGSAQARRGTAIVLNKLADLRRRAGDLPAAERSHREALALIEPLADAAPDDAQAQLDVAYVCQRLGELAASAGLADDARRWFDLALGRLRPLAARDCLPPAYEGWIDALEGD